MSGVCWYCTCCTLGKPDGRVEMVGAAKHQRGGWSEGGAFRSFTKDSKTVPSSSCCCTVVCLFQLLLLQQHSFRFPSPPGCCCQSKPWGYFCCWGTFSVGVGAILVCFLSWCLMLMHHSPILNYSTDWCWLILTWHTLFSFGHLIQRNWRGKQQSANRAENKMYKEKLKERGMFSLAK